MLMVIAYNRIEIKRIPNTQIICIIYKLNKLTARDRILLRYFILFGFVLNSIQYSMSFCKKKKNMFNTFINGNSWLNRIYSLIVTWATPSDVSSFAMPFQNVLLNCRHCETYWICFFIPFSSRLQANLSNPLIWFSKRISCIKTW